MVTANRIPNLNSFSLRVPADSEGNYRLDLAAVTVTSKTLRAGVLKLFQQLGIITGRDKGEITVLLQSLKECPDSTERNLLIVILESGTDNLPFIDCWPGDLSEELTMAEQHDAISSSQKPKEVVTTPAVTQSSLINDVTVLTPTELIILRAINDNRAAISPKSTRRLAQSLKLQGINISHMTIKRRMDAMKKEVINDKPI